MTDLGTLGGAESVGNAINNNGQVAGSSLTTSEGRHAFIFSGGTMTDLGTLGGPSSEALGMNNSGQQTGYSYISASVQHAFLYSDGAMYDLNSLVVSGFGGFILTEAPAINDSGQIIANACNGGCRAFRLDPIAAATPVPTVSRWMLAAMAILLVAASGIGWRKRET